MPSPSRECGDGSEAESTSPADKAATVKVAKPKMIRLPHTNIKLEKLPPIKDATVELKETAPTSPLVQVIEREDN